MNYSETLEYLYAKLPMFSRVGAVAMKKDLGNIRALCEVIGNPQEKFKSIHVAGTNGKGSICHMLSSVLQQANFKVGLYTSPHIKDFTERIRISGEQISQEAVIKFAERIRPHIEEIEPSFFEITVAMAFDYFAEQNVDIAIVETGLGGLLDSTNILRPELCIISNIGLDHTDMLGETLEEIASQKAGIIKEGVPLIVSETQEEVEHVFVNKALELDAPIIFADSIYDVVKLKSGKQFINRSTASTIKIATDLQASYQEKNIKAVLMAVDILSKKGFKVSSQDKMEGLATVKSSTGLKGRFEIISERPLIIFDTAHNKEGIVLSMQQLSKMSYANLHIIMGFVNDKPLNQVLPHFPSKAKYYFTQAQIPRALDAEKLFNQAQKFDLKGSVFSSVDEAYRQACASANEEDAILVIGSFFLLSSLYS